MNCPACGCVITDIYAYSIMIVKNGGTLATPAILGECCSLRCALRNIAARAVEADAE